jgi:hypothetical protein
LVEALCRKVEDSKPDEVDGFFFFFSIYLILPAALGSGVYSASNINKYQKQKECLWGIESFLAAFCELNV